MQVVMTEGVLHCSKPNLSAHARAAWMPQFSTQPIRYHSTRQPVSLAVPLVPLVVSDTGYSR